MAVQKCKRRCLDSEPGLRTAAPERELQKCLAQGLVGLKMTPTASTHNLVLENVSIFFMVTPNCLSFFESWELFSSSASRSRASGARRSTPEHGLQAVEAKKRPLKELKRLYFHHFSSFFTRFITFSTK